MLIIHRDQPSSSRRPAKGQRTWVALPTSRLPTWPYVQLPSKPSLLFLFAWPGFLPFFVRVSMLTILYTYTTLRGSSLPIQRAHHFELVYSVYIWFEVQLIYPSSSSLDRLYTDGAQRAAVQFVHTTEIQPALGPTWMFVWTTTTTELPFNTFSWLELLLKPPRAAPRDDPEFGRARLWRVEVQEASARAHMCSHRVMDIRFHK